MELGLVRRVDIDHEMQQSYLDYAMSVIVSRALPDARDGLKPVQRRILYGMYDMGLRAESGYKKSARIVGEVLGKYHPHGDQTVYEAMARLAQDFSMRYQLVDGQGNFGSVDGDPPAAMRYTEARLTPLALDLLLQLDRSTVDFVRNFDDTLNEPEVLPAAIPNLLVNGASGIAVGMATSVPPHNLNEVIDALIFMLEKWDKLEDIAVDDLMRFIKGPDFPTGGIILQEDNGEEMLSAYATGRGKVTLRGRVQLEEMGRGKSRIIITELPYQINKASLIERIAELTRESDLEGISDLRDESDRQGMRIVIELNKVAEEQTVLRALYRRTPLQTTYRISLLALVDGEPHMLTLKQALRVYLDHRIAVIKRRSEHDLEKARQKAHVLEGLRVALKNLDEIIDLIRRAQDVEDARTKLMRRYKLSEIQSNAILEMQLRRLASLERKKIELEYQDIVKLIKSLEELLRSPKKLRLAVSDELLAMKQSYADRRRTQIVSLKNGTAAKDVLTTSDLMPEENMWIGVTEDGKIGRISEDKLPRTSGRMAPRWLYRTNSRHTLFLAGKDGRAAAIAVQSVPEVQSFADGAPYTRVSQLAGKDSLSQLISVPNKSAQGVEKYILTVTRSGLVKKSPIEELPGPSTQLITMVKVNSGDELGWVFLTDGKSDIVLVTRKGMLIRFSEEDVRPMGLVAAGVNGIKLAGDDQVIGAVRFDPKAEILLVAGDGKGWRLPADQLVQQGRYGQGTVACRPSPDAGLVGVLYGKRTETGLLHFKEMAAKTIRIDQIPAGRRLSSGKVILPLKTNERILAVSSFVDGVDDRGGQGAGPSGQGSARRAKTQPEDGNSTNGKAVRSVKKAATTGRGTAKPNSKRPAKKPTQAAAAPRTRKSAAPPDKTGTTTRKTTPKAPAGSAKNKTVTGRAAIKKSAELKQLPLPEKPPEGAAKSKTRQPKPAEKASTGGTRSRKSTAPPAESPPVKKQKPPSRSSTRPK